MRVVKYIKSMDINREMKNIKKRLPIILLLLIVFSIAFILLNTYKDSRINEMLNEQSKYLEISYKQGLDRFNVIANNIYTSMQDDEEFISILSNTNAKNIDVSHYVLYKHLKDEFFRLKVSGVMGLLVITPDSKVIVRMHKEDKYGDSLAKSRPIVKKLNEEKIHLHGFEEGKTSHAFRELYPIYQDGKYIGAVEILFSSTKIQDYTMRASDIHTHFIVNKNVFKTNEWKSNIAEPYEQSIEHKDYLFSLNDHINHTRLDKSQKDIIEPLREEITEGIESGKNFKIYKKLDKTAQILVFMPVKRFVDKKTVAYIVSYTNSSKLYSFLKTNDILNIILLIVILLTYFLISRLQLEKESMVNELKFDGLTNVYNRKYFMNSSQKVFKKLQDTNENYSIVMADIDYFKKVNDTYGHQYGDDVLREFATLLKESLRSLDKVARYGGEEFVILLLTDELNSVKVIEGIRKAVEVYDFGEKSIKLTASFGIAQYKDDYSLEEIIKRADTALYKAKENGRNQLQTG